EHVSVPEDIVVKQTGKQRPQTLAEQADSEEKHCGDLPAQLVWKDQLNRSVAATHRESPEKERRRQQCNRPRTCWHEHGQGAWDSRADSRHASDLKGGFADSLLLPTIAAILYRLLP